VNLNSDVTLIDESLYVLEGTPQVEQATIGMKWEHYKDKGIFKIELVQK